MPTLRLSGTKLLHSQPLRVWLGIGLLLFMATTQVAMAKRMVNTCPEVETNESNIHLVAPVFQYTVTHFDASWFDTREPEKAPTLFVITLDPALRQYSGTLRLHVQILADTSLGRPNGLGGAMIAMDKVTEPLDSLTSIGIPMRSNDLFALNYEPSGIDFEKSDLFNYVAQNRVVPEMNLSFRFGLTCENDGNVIANAQTEIEVRQLGPTGKLRQVRTVRALAPGNDIANVRPASIYTITPTFQLASELFNNQEFGYPPDEPKMEIFVYRVEPGQSTRDALDGIEYAKFPVQDMNPTVYPPGQLLLEPGRTYVWRVRANLRGPTLEHLWSNTLMFKIDPILGGGTPEAPQTVGDLRTFATQVKYGDDYSKRVLAALKIILAENYEVFDLSRSEKIPAKGLLRLNGQPITLEELERLAQEFHQARHLMTRMRFQ
jgi:hypothetical protein